MSANSVTVAALTHELLRKWSIATLIWDGDPEKRVALPVPFGCGLDRGGYVIASEREVSGIRVRLYRQAR